ncbi:putative C6 transcription factor [Phyllosticta capitalensis]|uniref:C6 transcription factor n=2 Tax=Phyllosticta capitalensis TaxID=121624 RepID=A0ABR1YW59_9PEZI
MDQVTRRKTKTKMCSPEEAQEPPQKKLRRSYVACHRCHSHKIKCSGEKPCRSCSKSNNSAHCVYPVRDRKVVISESYLRKLETENASLKHKTPSSTADTPPSSEDSKQLPQQDPGDDTDVDVASVDVANPLLEEHMNQRPSSFDRISKPLYLGGAACTAFGTRLRYHVKGEDMAPPPRRVVFYKHRGLLRIANTEFQLPNKTYARMLVQVVLRFIGSDYHLIQRKSFMRRLDETYSAQTHNDPVFLCRLFVVFALGELYSKKTAVAGNRRSVPGTSFFLQAMNLFQDLHEEADVDYIETLLVMSFYSHALNRKNTAYTYAGLALRLSLTLGLHRNITYDKNISAVEIENRRRVWWTVYTFDRLCSSKLGHPVMIRDEDIDAPYPSVDGLTPEEREEFIDVDQLCANIKLAQITGNILNLIYSIPGAQHEVNFVRNVHKILTSLKEWDASLKPGLRLDHTVTPPYKSRSVASLRLHFNQCIMLTTRPILLYVFKYHVRPAGTASSPNTSRPLSPMTTALSEACIHAARNSNKLLAQLWIDGAIATFGYFDAHYIFSSTIVLLMANILNPSESDKDAIDLAWSLLQSMADDGNLPASEYWERLALLQKDLDDMCGVNSPDDGPAASRGNPVPAIQTPPQRKAFAQQPGLKLEPQLSPQQSSAAAQSGALAQEQGASASADAPAVSTLLKGLSSTNADAPAEGATAAASPAAYSLLGEGAGAPLDDPYIQDFLTHPDTEWSPGTLGMAGESSVPWGFAWEAGELQGGFGRL